MLIPSSFRPLLESAGFGTWVIRLPRFQRAGPSTSLDEHVNFWSSRYLTINESVVQIFGSFHAPLLFFQTRNIYQINHIKCQIFDFFMHLCY